MSAGTGKLAVVAAGGTGGHLFPAEALARALIDRGWRIVLATDARGAAYADAFPAEERLALEAATFSLRDPIGTIRGAYRIGAGVRRARDAFQRLKPAVVIGFGGYPSLPALLAARSLRLPRLIHEQNAVLGRVNRFQSRSVDAVACAFPTLRKAPAGLIPEVVGNPVRPDIRALYDTDYSPPNERVRLLVTGGSQGARLLSETVPAAVALLPAALRHRLDVAQQTRANALEAARRTFAEASVHAEVAPFFGDMARRLGQAHLVVGRAGASTICELAVAGRPSVLIPLAIAADDHQRFNASLLADIGAAVIVSEAELSPDSLAQTLAPLLADPARLAAMSHAARSTAKPDAAQRLANLVERVAG